MFSAYFGKSMRWYSLAYEAQTYFRWSLLHEKKRETGLLAHATVRQHGQVVRKHKFRLLSKGRFTLADKFGIVLFETSQPKIIWWFILFWEKFSALKTIYS